MAARGVTVAWWNRKWNGGGQRQLRFLSNFDDWDVLVLAEVTGAAFGRFRSLGESTFFTLDEVSVTDRRYPHGIAILARHGWSIAEAAPFACGGEDDLVCRAERGVAATIAFDNARFRLIGWQAPYAAGRTTAEKQRNPFIKRHGYEHLLQLIEVERRRLVVALDGNNWGDGLDPAPVTSTPDDPWHIEHRFHGPDPEHGLVDSLREAVRRDPERTAAVTTGGPLAVTKTTPHAGQHRMDRIYVSTDVDVEDAGVVYTNAEGQITDSAGFDLRTPTVGSDHALIWAHLRIG